MVAVSSEGLKVAKVAALLGMSRNQLLNWERLELIRAPRTVNPDSGMEDRVYGEDELKRLRFIKKLKEDHGLGLDTIKFFLEYLDTGHIILADEAWKSL